MPRSGLFLNKLVYCLRDACLSVFVRLCVNLIYTIQYNTVYNTIKLIFDIALRLVHSKPRIAPSRLGGAHALNCIMQSIVGEEFDQVPYVAARVGFEPATLRTEGTEPYH